jgi:hypothetical protein
MSNKLTEYRNKVLTQLEKHVAIEREYFRDVLKNQELLLSLQSQNWYQSWKISYLETKIKDLGFTGKIYQDLDKHSSDKLSEWQENLVKKNLAANSGNKKNAKA